MSDAPHSLNLAHCFGSSTHVWEVLAAARSPPTPRPAPPCPLSRGARDPACEMPARAAASFTWSAMSGSEGMGGGLPLRRPKATAGGRSVAALRADLTAMSKTAARSTGVV
eukprot:CAMPEP_0206042498 /NCGR_PEP_ID=MMETSP1466-20131121/6592_1 /ASSEMBLY_ACC=CAM_ASM_001126 /TAXON_ID=44452 /ORGANISM="Pavlova gyrans, Strain CCMP608" /LENGTH=110 /DNA_ID=CAMNT_0053417207 /DNA_START=118 /DNA_END=450 /DNA_ORIENTATION=+